MPSRKPAPFAASSPNAARPVSPSPRADPMIPIVHTSADLARALAAWREAGQGGIALVPTMGALHEGHLSLVARARAHAPNVVVSIFVNPAQFAPHEDFSSYPRTLEADRAKLEQSDAGLIFAPSAAEMYPDGFATTVSVAGPAAGLESDFRPHFFAGVATIVTKLLIAVRPDYAMFGEKDYQQLLVVKKLTRDLGLPTEIIACPIAREADGLAMSSRNAYLNAAERQVAGRLNAILREAAEKLNRGGEISQTEAAAVAALKEAGFDSVDYVAVRDADTLQPVRSPEKKARILAAAKIGRTRLIDNWPV
jgi:pantoate--beta-alanine ligase